MPGLRRLFVRIGNVEGDPEGPVRRGGFVMTIDDVTPLVLAQRKAAWSDVAMRVAHEIKNPLTPITLSAERLERKFAGGVTESPEVFLELTDTIKRQAMHMTHVVNEFSRHARMPTLIMALESAVDIVEKAIRLQEISDTRIIFERSYPETPPVVHCDGDMICAAIFNIVKNAAEAFRMDDVERVEGDIVKATIAEEGAWCVIRIDDNGPGFPVERPETLLEPHESHGKDDGYGLGLTIARSTIRDHGGDLVLQNRKEGGASVILSLPLERKDG